MKGPWLLPFVVASFAALMVAIMGATITDLGPWYQALAKPSWTPPDPLFPIVWTIVYALLTVAGVTAWRDAPTSLHSQGLIGLFAFNAFLNIGWSVLFFRFQRPDWALYALVALWLSTLATTVYCGRFSRNAGLTLAAYLAWLTLLTGLNWAITDLNGPFG
ncbi:MAG: TspO/MBR family protein [Pseudomonadota bacterium]